MNKINLKVGDLFQTKHGGLVYIKHVEYTDQFNEKGIVVKYITLHFLNGLSEGRTSWTEEGEVLDLIDTGVYKYIPVKE